MCSKKGLKMEDRLAWTDTLAPYALHGVGIQPEIMEMWGDLRSGVEYFMRYLEGQHKQVHLDDAQNSLLRYAIAVEKHFGERVLLTQMLHGSTVHLPEEVRACGKSASRAEFWVERAMQVCTLHLHCDSGGLVCSAP